MFVRLTMIDSALTREQSSLERRSEITLTDENSKHGTAVDGERISTGQKVLTNDEHVFRLGSYENAFR